MTQPGSQVVGSSSADPIRVSSHRVAAHLWEPADGAYDSCIHGDDAPLTGDTISRQCARVLTFQQVSRGDHVDAS